MNLAISKNAIEDCRELPRQKARVFGGAHLPDHAVRGEEAPETFLPPGASMCSWLI